LVARFCTSQDDPLRQLRTAVARTTKQFYKSYGVAIPDPLWKGTRLALKHCTDTGLSFAPEIHFRLCTMFGPGDPDAAQVILTLAPRLLDRITIAALPRALLHEYVCHVAQGPYDAPRAHPEEDSFADGWMDYVAHLIHRAALEQQQGPSRALAEYLFGTWLSQYDYAAEHFFTARCALRDGAPDAAQRNTGADAAWKLHRYLRVLARTRKLRQRATPDKLLYRLSFWLNASSLTSAERRQFVVEVRRLPCLKDASRSDDPGLLGDWAAGRITVPNFVTCLLG
jgi:hypothetical protein